MKNFAIIVTAIATLSIAGCKKNEEKAADTATTTTTTTTTNPAGKPTDTAPVDPAAAGAAVDPAAAGAAPAAAGTTTTTTTTEDLTTGITECDDLVKRYNACEKLPAEQKAAFLDGAKAWKASAATGSDDVKKSTAEACKAAATSADSALKTAGC